MKGRIVSLVRKCGLGLGVALGVLVIAELGLWAMGAEPAINEVVDPATCYYGWGPHSEHRWEKPGTPLWEQLVTDGQGFRVSAVAPPMAAEASGCTVLALGDSFTQGAWVRAEEAWPAQLEASLALAQRPCQVRNGGVVGQTIPHALYAARYRWRAVEAQTVVFATSANDLRDLVAMRAQGCGLDPLQRPSTGATLRQLLPPALAWSRLAGALQQGSFHAIAFITQRDSPQPSRAACDGAMETYLDHAEALARWTRGEGQHLLIAVLETPGCGDRLYPNFPQQLAARTTGLGAQVIEFRDLELEGARLGPYDGHPSPAGHQAIAEEIGQALCSAGALGECEVEATAALPRPAAAAPSP